MVCLVSPAILEIYNNSLYSRTTKKQKKKQNTSIPFIIIISSVGDVGLKFPALASEKSNYSLIYIIPVIKSLILRSKLPSGLNNMHVIHS